LLIHALLHVFGNRNKPTKKVTNCREWQLTTTLSRWRVPTMLPVTFSFVSLFVTGRMDKGNNPSESRFAVLMARYLL
jgi:hypothetical protein